MRDSLLRWGTVVGAMPRALTYYERLKTLSNYERLRFCNAVLGPEWAFRLHDIVGSDVIAAARPSWLSFYRDDAYGLHMPLDPRAPETDRYLGRDMGAKEYAFYCGMGFDGYLLALNTKRIVDEAAHTVAFDDRILQGLDVVTLRQLAVKKLTPEDYYSAYGAALDALFDAYRLIVDSEASAVPEERIESAAAASLIFLCGGHQGCSAHVDESEAQSTRFTTIMLCKYARALAAGEFALRSLSHLSRAA